MGWRDAADKETAERRFEGFLKGSKAKIRKSQERMEKRQEESMLDEEMKKNKQGGFVASPDTKKGQIKAALKAKRQAAKTPEQIDSGQHARTYPRKPGQKPWQANTSRSLRHGSRNYKSKQKRLAKEPDYDDDGSLTAAERNYGDRSFYK